MEKILKSLKNAHLASTPPKGKDSRANTNKHSALNLTSSRSSLANPLSISSSETSLSNEADHFPVSFSDRNNSKLNTKYHSVNKNSIAEPHPFLASKTKLANILSHESNSNIDTRCRATQAYPPFMPESTNLNNNNNDFFKSNFFFHFPTTLRVVLSLKLSF